MVDGESTKKRWDLFEQYIFYRDRTHWHVLDIQKRWVHPGHTKKHGLARGAVHQPSVGCVLLVTPHLQERAQQETPGGCKHWELVRVHPDYARCPSYWVHGYLVTWTVQVTTWMV